jgi:hypothetical protein
MKALRVLRRCNVSTPCAALLEYSLWPVVIAPAPSFAQTTARPPAPALGFITAASCNASAQAESTPFATCRNGNGGHEGNGARKTLFINNRPALDENDRLTNFAWLFYNDSP